jgi:tetrahydromethanopterin S-methyltransferase subunit G
MAKRSFLENGTEATRGLSPLPTGTQVYVDRLPQMDIIHLQSEINQIAHRVYDLGQKLDGLTKEIERIEEDKIIEFKNNDVYEVNKRIERIEAKVALISSSLVNNRVVRFLLRYTNVW